MVASEHTEVIDGRRWFIATYIIDSEKESEDGSIDNYGSDSDEDDESGSVEACVRKGFTQSGTEEGEDMHPAVKYSSLSSYILKPTSLLTQVFNNNKKSLGKLFKRMFNFGARA